MVSKVLSDLIIYTLGYFNKPIVYK